MKVKFLCSILIAIFYLVESSIAFASFAREFERLNRERSLERLSALDQSIQISVEEKELEEAEEEEEREVLPAKEEDLMPEQAWLVQPRISIEGKRETNVFQYRNDAEPESTMIYAPGIGAATALGDWKYQTDYELDYLQHRHFTHNDRFEHSWNQSLFRKGTKMRLSVRNLLSFSSLPTEEADEKLPEMKTNSFFTETSYKISPKITLAGYYNNQYCKFRDTAHKTNTILNDIFGSKVYYNLKPRLNLSFEYSYRFSRPPKRPETDDIDVQDFRLGLQGSITPKIRASINAGVESKEFTSSDDKVGVVIEGAARYYYSEKTSFSFRFQRDQIPLSTEMSGDPLHHYVAMGVNYQYNPKLMLSVSEGIRLQQMSDATTVTDPDNPDITTTKKDESHRLTTRLRATFKATRNLSMDFDYQFQKAGSELKTSDCELHITQFRFVQQF